jgi:hypothetical protein
MKQKKLKKAFLSVAVNSLVEFIAVAGGPGLPDFSWSKYTKMGKITNDRKLYQTDKDYTKWP